MISAMRPKYNVLPQELPKKNFFGSYSLSVSTPCKILLEALQVIDHY